MIIGIPNMQQLHLIISLCNTNHGNNNSNGNNNKNDVNSNYNNNMRATCTPGSHAIKRLHACNGVRFVTAS